MRITYNYLVRDRQEYGKIYLGMVGRVSIDVSDEARIEAINYLVNEAVVVDLLKRDVSEASQERFRIVKVEAAEQGAQGNLSDAEVGDVLLEEVLNGRNPLEVREVDIELDRILMDDERTQQITAALAARKARLLGSVKSDEDPRGNEVV